MAEAPKFTIEIDDLASPALAEMVRKVEAAKEGRAFDRRCIADSIRSMAETMSDERYCKADALAAFVSLAGLVEGPHTFGEFVLKVNAEKEEER